MTERLGEATLELRTDDDAFTRGVNRAESQAKRLGATFDSVGRAAQRIGRQISTFVTLPILAVGAASVKTASDIQEMRNLFAVTFGRAAGDVEEWAKRTAVATNRSRFELMRTAADFAAFLKPLGVAPEAIVPMSKALTQLSTDIASFRNLTDEEVFTRLFSGLAGETEAVRRLGIDIGQAAIEQELLRLGIEKNATTATQAEKVMARYSLIMRQTADAQGDAERTADSFQNQTKALGATVTDVREAIGSRLLPVATRMIQKVRELGNEFLSLSSHTQSGIIAIGALAATVGPAILALGLLSRAIGFALVGFAFIPKVLYGVWRAIRFAIIGIQVILVGFLGFFTTIPGLIITSLAAIVGGFFIFKDTIIGFVKGLVIALKNELVAGFNNKVVRPFQESINALVRFLPDSVVEFLGLQPLEVSDIIENSFADEMKGVIAEATENGKREFEEFRDTAAGAFDFIKTKFGDFKAAAADFIPETIENIGAKFEGLAGQFSALAGAASSIGGTVVDTPPVVGVDPKQIKQVRDQLFDLEEQALRAQGKTAEAIRLAASRQIEEWRRVAIETPELAGVAAQAIVRTNELAAAEIRELTQSVGELSRFAIEDNLTQALTAARSFGDAIRGILLSIAEAFIRLRLVTPFVDFLTTKIPGFASGGRPPVGSPAIVGERGPELFVPDSAGTIVPNHEIGGMGGVSQEFNFPFAIPPQIEAMIRNVAGPAGRDAAPQLAQAQRGRF